MYVCVRALFSGCSNDGSENSSGGSKRMYNPNRYYCHSFFLLHFLGRSLERCNVPMKPVFRRFTKYHLTQCVCVCGFSVRVECAVFFSVCVVCCYYRIAADPMNRIRTDQQRYPKPDSVDIFIFFVVFKLVSLNRLTVMRYLMFGLTA